MVLLIAVYMRVFVYMGIANSSSSINHDKQSKPRTHTSKAEIKNSLYHKRI